MSYNRACKCGHWVTHHTAMLGCINCGCKKFEEHPMPAKPIPVVLTPEHSLWREFCDRLAGPEACNFQGEGEDVTWTCAGGRNQDFSKAILQTMDGIDVEGTLLYFSEHGGHCDCEVLFNVDRDLGEP